MCTILNCQQAHYAKGLCKQHYDRLRRRGTTGEWTPPPTPRCTIAGCVRPHYGNGVCKLHYDRLRKRGSVEDPRDAMLRFKAKFIRASDCWTWTGAANPVGYGRFRHGNRTVAAHRFAYESWIGPIPHGLHIDHTCANPSCVNPAHLEPVTQAENNRRAGERAKAA